jgi:cytochrome c oxidase subunit 2
MMRWKLVGQSLSMGLLIVMPMIGNGAAVPQETPRRIDVVVKRFSFSPAEITLKKGEPVVFLLTSQDVAHGLKFEELNLDTEIKKNTTGELVFTPSRTGDFIGHCSHFCGAGHGSMALTLHVIE